MAEPALVARCFTAMQSAVDIPVTIKTRIGIDDRDDYDFFRDFISTLYEAGCTTFVVHARKALLSGLSPKENRDVPPLNYEFVRRIKDEYPQAQFILNGGIDDTRAAVDLLNAYDGIMLGRAVYQRPFLLSELEAMIFDHDSRDALSVLRDYQDYMERQLTAGEKLKHMARHLLGLFSGRPGARKFRRYLSEHMFAENAGPEVVDAAARLVRRDDAANEGIAA